MKKILRAITIFIFLVHSHLHSNDTKETWITVYVHGVMSIRKHINMDNFMLFMRDKIDHTIYAKTVEYMRQDTYFYLNQAMQGFGLLPLDINRIEKNAAPNAIARIYNKTTKACGAPKSNNYYYTFGWSGLMSPSHRYQEAEHFFQVLENEIERFKLQGITPKIRIIGYSHGGNICLNLAAIQRDFYPQSPLSIDELILIGVPIQTETDYLVASPLFKKIYNIYSPHDRIQQIDLFSFNRILSRKNFVSRHDFTIPNNLIQIELKIRRLRKSKRRRSQRKIDITNPLFISGNAPYLRNTSPGHIELWFFGWTPEHYRQDFVLNSLPVLVTLPYVFHALEQHKESINNNYTVIVDIRPDQELLLIKQYQPRKSIIVAPFLSKELHDSMNKIAKKVTPNNFDSEEYNQHISQAYHNAIDYNATHKPKISGRKAHKPRRLRRRRKIKSRID